MIDATLPIGVFDSGMRGLGGMQSKMGPGGMPGMPPGGKFPRF